jgi:hypothetical protein
MGWSAIHTLLSRLILFRDWQTRGRGPAQSVFYLGKVIGVTGRVVTTIVVVTAIGALVFDPKLSLALGYVGLVLFWLIALTETLSHLLMAGGNWWASRFGNSR